MRNNSFQLVINNGNIISKSSSDQVASSIAMIIFCIGMTRNGFESFQISVIYLMIISVILYSFVKQKIKFNPSGLNLIPFAVLGFLIIPMQMIIDDGYYNAGDAFDGAFVYFMMIMTISIIVNKSNGSYLWKIVNCFALFGSILIIVEEVFYLSGIRLDQVAGMNDTIFRAFKFQFYRPSGMFSEPSHFAEMGLLTAFYYLFISRNCIKLAIVCSALIISTSALGIVGLVLMFLLYAIHYIFSKSVGQLKKTVFIVLLLICGTVLIYWVFMTDNLVVLRILEGSTSSVRVNRSFELYDLLDPVEKVFGIGTQNQAYYLDFHGITLPSDAAETLAHREFAQTFGYILCTLGLVGMIAFWTPFLKMFIKGSYASRSLILMFGFVCLTACINGRPSILVYMILIYSLYTSESIQRTENNNAVPGKPNIM